MVAPEADVWTFPIDAPCEDPASIGPFLGLGESFIPHTERYLTLEILEAGTYTASMTTSAKTSVALSDCDAPFATYAGG